MTTSPTLRHHDESVDGWVEYLQTMLQVNRYSMADATPGVFDDFTLDMVKRFQEDHGLKADGIVGDATWAVLRGEEPARAGTDRLGRGEFTDEGVKLRLTTEIDFLQPDDMLWFRAFSVGTEEPEPGTVEPYIHLKLPDGSSRQLHAEHEVNGDGWHEFRAHPVTEGVGGEYSVFIALPSETGGDNMQWGFRREEHELIDL